MSRIIHGKICLCRLTTDLWLYKWFRKKYIGSLFRAVSFFSRQVCVVFGNTMYWWLLNTIRMEFPELPGEINRFRTTQKEGPWRHINKNNRGLNILNLYITFVIIILLVTRYKCTRIYVPGCKLLQYLSFKIVNLYTYTYMCIWKRAR